MAFSPQRSFPMKPFHLLAIALSLTGGLLAQSVEEWPLRPLTGQPPPAEEISYRPQAPDDRGFNRVVQAIAVPTVTVYRPARPRVDRAALVVCPGGGYRYVVIDREGHYLARHFQARGFTVAVLKYRLPQPALSGGDLPLSQQDALEALRLMRRRAGEWNIDPGRVGILGSSAGGHLAASTAVWGRAEDGSRPDFVALLYPVITLEPPYAHEGSRLQLLGENATAEQIAFYSLHRRVQPGMPPFFLVHAQDDRAVPPENSQLMADALEKAGVPVRLLLVSRGGHGFALGRGPESAIWPDVFVQWVDGLRSD